MEEQVERFLSNFTCDEDGQHYFSPPVGNARLPVTVEEVWAAEGRFRWAERLRVPSFAVLVFGTALLTEHRLSGWSQFGAVLGAMLIGSAIWMWVDTYFVLGTMRKRWIRLEQQQRAINGP